LEKGKVDLHVHTNFSDGTFTPAQTVEKAKELGFRAIAITDHDALDGIDAAAQEGKKLGVEIIPGVELTAYYNKAEIHILGYYIDYKTQWFRKKMEEFCRDRIKRAERILEKLREYDIDLNMEELQLLKGHGFLGRLHIANLLKMKGHVKSLGEAFERFIGDYKPCYIPKIAMAPREAIEMVLKVKGIPVFAHQALTQRDGIIPDLVKHGLMGIEVYHSEHSAQNSRYYQKIAQKHNLLETGGSDCHGLGKGEVLMGKVSVSYEVVEKLKELKRKLDEQR